MDHFRADSLLIGRLFETESLRYTGNNIAKLMTVFSIPGNKNESKISVLISGEDAELLSKKCSIGRWFEVKGELKNSPPPNIEVVSPIIVAARSLLPLPVCKLGLATCEIIGRLTKDPEKITKTNDFKFLRFALAVNRKEAEKPSFFNFSVFKSATSEKASSELSKGDSIFASGELAFFRAGEEQKLNYSIKLDRYIKLESIT
jgi:single-stranded DNA-binding protein